MTNLTNRILLPLMCFCLSWGVTRHFGAKDQPPDSPAAAVSSGTQSAADAAPTTRRLSPDEFAGNFAAAQTTEWAGLWADFAGTASRDDLDALTRIGVAQRLLPAMDPGMVVRGLAAEELALRDHTVPISRGAIAALAERDGEKAWQAVLASRASMVSAATLRMLAIQDPQAALEKWKTLGPERGPEWTGENDVIHSPLGSIFAAWTRRDPAAAMAAADRLSRDDRRTAQAEIALTLAYHDGPAGLRYVLDCGDTDGFRMDAILRSAFSQSRGTSQTVAALLRDHPSLRKGSQRYYLGPWYRTDPAAAREWARSAADGEVDLYALMAHDPGAVLERIAAAPPSHEDAGFLVSLSRDFPAQAKAVAEARGIWPEVEKRLLADTADPDPASKVREILALIEDYGADQVADVRPMTAGFRDSLLDCARRYLPEAVGAVESITIPPPGRRTGPFEDGAPLPSAEFDYDPAAAARFLRANPVSERDAWFAVRNWAPYDFAAARDWVETLPAGPARERAEIALLEHTPHLTGEAMVERLLTQNPEAFQTPAGNTRRLRDLTEYWTTGLLRISHEGGDWRAWYARIPAACFKDGLAQTSLERLRSRLELEESVLRELR